MWRKTATMVSGATIAAMLMSNVAFAATGATQGQGYATSSAKAVQINVLTGLGQTQQDGGLLGGLLGGVTGTVGGVLGGVTNTVGGVVSDPVGTATSVVSNPVGTVTNTAGGLLGGLTGSTGGLLGGVTGTAGGLLGGLTGGDGGLLGGVLNTTGGLVNGVVGTVGGVVDSVAQVGSDLPLIGPLLDALLPLGTNGISIEAGMSNSTFKGAESTASGYPLGLLLLGKEKLIPIQAQADATTGHPVTKSALNLNLLSGLAKVNALGVAANVTPAKSESASSVAGINVAGLITLGAVQAENSGGKNAAGAMVADSHFHVADLNVLGLVKVKALDAIVHAEANGAPGGAKATADTTVAQIEVAGIPITIKAGEVIEIPGIARVALNASSTSVDPQGKTAKASAGVLEVTLLSALLNGISVKVGFVDAEVGAAAGPAYTLSKSAQQDTVEPGGIITYHLVYRMNRNVNNAVITDKLPANTTFVSADNGGTYDAANNQIVWRLGSKPAGAGGVLTAKLQVDPQTKAGTVIRNVATISADNEKPVDSNTTDVNVGAKVHAPFFIGFPDGTFRPEQSVTRAEIATVAARIMNLQNSSNYPVYYEDVQNHWAKPYIAAVTAAGLMPGHSGRNFDPDQPATRAEVASVLVRMHTMAPIDFADLPGNSASFLDVPASHPAYNDIETAVRLGLIEGYGNGYFGPNDAVTRAQTATLFDRALGRGPLVDGAIAVIQHFPDMSRNHWAFGWVEEAASVGHKGIWNGSAEALQTYVDSVTAW